MNQLDVVVATIGKAHGLRGEAVLILRTDQPEVRLADGAAFEVEQEGHRRTLTITSTRVQANRWYARFDEVAGRDDIESLRGVELRMEVDVDEEGEEDPDAWYLSELKGLTVRHVDGTELGTVIDLEHYPAQDLLIVRTKDGGRVMLPLVEELVPEVDLDAGVVIADPPGGLFDTENADSERD